MVRGHGARGRPDPVGGAGRDMGGARSPCGRRADRGARHEIMAPAAGRLRHDVKKLYVIEPGAVIGRVEAR
ncbi:MAG: hypothetical protein WDN45_15685 [Caulobacteraceae bacterium]